MDIKEIVALESAELVDAIARKYKDDINRESFNSDLNKVWKEYRVAKYGRLAFLHKYLFWNTLLYEVCYHTTIRDYPEYWFNKKWLIRTDGGKFYVTNKEKQFVMRFN